MKRILGAVVFVLLFLANTCLAAEFQWLEVICDYRDSQWRFSTDMLLQPGYSPSYEVSATIGSDTYQMEHLYYGGDVYDSGVIGTPSDFVFQPITWTVFDGVDTITASSAWLIPDVMRQVAPSTNITVSGDPANPTVSWTNPEASNPALINYYRLRVTLASDPMNLLYQTTIPNPPPGKNDAECIIDDSFEFQPGVDYLIRLEARQQFYFPVTGDSFGPFFPRVWDEGQQEWVMLASLLNRSTVFVNYVYLKIDIKPGSDPNSINLKSKGVVPVAVLTNDFFDAAVIDPDTVLFAGASPERWTMCDVDNDGDQDMLFHFRTQDLDLYENSTEAFLGCYIGGEWFESSDSVRIVPAPKKK